MDELSVRVSRLQRTAWRIRDARPVCCDLPFALALMTDERVHHDLPALIGRLPSETPILIVFRHYGVPTAERLDLAQRAYRTAKSRGHFLVVARGGIAADGVHNGRGPGFRSGAVHSLAQGVARSASRTLNLAFVSPVLSTASHPDSRPLGPVRAAAIAGRLDCPAFALGGMNRVSAQRLIGSPFAGIAVLSAIRT